MAQYKINTATQVKDPKRGAHLALEIIIISLIIGYIPLALIFFDSNKSGGNAKKTVVASFESTKSLHETDYFKFTTDKYWKLDEEASKDGYFYYRKRIGNDFAASIRITVGLKLPPNDRYVPMVIPVTQNYSDNKLSIGEVSPPCNELTPEDSKSIKQVVTYKNASFYCTPDNVSQALTLAIVNGDDNMLLRRPSGGEANYSLRYETASSKADIGEATSIFSTFEVK